MITSIRIKNFKSLRDTKTLEIKPLTVLVGPNSSGKSSVLQLLLMLKQTIESGDVSSTLVANSTLVQLGNYPDFIFKGLVAKRLHISLRFSGYRTFDSREKSERQLDFETVINYNRRLAQIALVSSRIAAKNEIELIISKSKTSKDFELRFKDKTYPDGTGGPVPVVPYHFYKFGLSFKSFQAETARKLPDPEIFNLSSYVERELQKLQYIGPLREFPKRVYFSTGLRPSEVGSSGEKTVDVLWQNFRAENPSNLELISKVQYWFREFGFAHKIEVVRLGTENVYKVVVTDPSTRHKVGLTDSGFGISQILPIVVESFLAPSGTSILIEQPEIHLHPKAQAILADMFIEAATDKKRGFIIETHSEHLLSRIRRRIADPQCSLTRDDVAIYYFKPTSNGTEVIPIGLNSLGQYTSFPDGFFEEDVVEAFEHLSLIAELKKHE